MAHKSHSGFISAFAGLMLMTFGLPAAAELAGLVHDDQNGSLRAVSIDSATGTITTGAQEIIECCWMGAGLTAVDTAGERFFGVGVFSAGNFQGDAAVVTLSFDGSAVSAVAPDALPQALLAYDELADRLVSVALTPGQNREIQWLSIDPATGTTTSIGPALTDCCEIASGLAAIDAASQVLYFIGRSFDTNPWQLLAMDMAAGSVSGITELPPGRAGFLARDPANGQLDVLMQTAPAAPVTLHRINPGNGSTTLIATHDLDDCCLVNPGAVASLDADTDYWWVGGGIGMTPSPGYVALNATNDTSVSESRELSAGFRLNALVVNGEVIISGVLFQDRFEM